MRHAHAMPFGAELQARATRFRLWAPTASQVYVELDNGDRGVHRLSALPGGWFEARVDAVAAGARYAFRCDGGQPRPDPASRANPDGVHGASAIVDPRAYAWRQGRWRGRPWHEAVIYELHVGTFTPAGTFLGVIDRLDDLADLGITALELMPIADFPGAHNWGYDGVLPFAPARCYGTPDELKQLVDAAHARGLMVFLDVVYNHFGPEGNYLHGYARTFFDPRHSTPWGDAIRFAGEGSGEVRAFFVHNALYWLDEYQIDGLRLDAVHAIVDASTPDIVSEIAVAVRDFATRHARQVHVVLENERNEAWRLARDQRGAPRTATAQWNDDLHHALHVIVSGEVDGYYADYADAPIERFGRSLAEGFAYQGEASAFREGAPRGEPSAALPPMAFVASTQTHDQIGNRAFGERLVALAKPRALRAVTACVLLAPAIPMLFMGEEFAASTPFQFFCDFGGELAQAVADGRREEFSRFACFRDPQARAAIPDPGATSTFATSVLDRHDAQSETGAFWRAFYRQCLTARREFIVPHLARTTNGGRYRIAGGALLRLRWTLAPGCTLHMAAQLADTEVDAVDELPGTPIYESDAGAARGGRWQGYTVAVAVEGAR
ncbi:MAG: malto-oligosyltrehalose trehalohydrolase [Betaproteobacteria bacterium]